MAQLRDNLIGYNLKSIRLVKDFRDGDRIILMAKKAANYQLHRKIRMMKVTDRYRVLRTHGYTRDVNISHKSTCSPRPPRSSCPYVTLPNKRN